MFDAFSARLMIDVKKTLRYRNIYIWFIVIVLSFAATFARNLYITEISNQKTIGALNTFIYGAIYDNPIIALLAPFIASILFSREYLCYNDHPRQCYIYKCAYFYNAVSIAVRTSIFFFASYLLGFLLILCVDGTASLRQDYFSHALFITVYDRSMLIYCICIVLFIMVYAAAYSFLAYGLSNAIGNLHAGVILPGVLSYFLIYFAVAIVPNVSESVFAYIIPYQTYDTTSGMNPIRYFTQIATVLGVGVLTNYIAVRKTMQGGL